MFCRHCGSDARTGWSEGAEFSDIEIPDYEEIIENEFGPNPNKKMSLSKVVSFSAAVIVTLAFILAMVI